MHTFFRKQTLVTGAASGLGRCLSLSLAKRGADLFLVDIDEDRLASVADQVRSVGGLARTLVCDSRDRHRIRELAQTVRDTWHGLDLLINNAGVCHYGCTLEMTEETWDRVLEVNLHAPIQLVQEFLPSLLARADGHIVNIASIQGMLPLGMNCAYDTSKAGLIGFSEALYAEFSRKGLRVTLACPGYVRTDLFEKMTCSSKSKRRIPPNWLMANPERVAERIVRAIEKNRFLVLPTAMAWLLYYLKRFCPTLSRWFIRIQRGKRKPIASTVTPE